MRVDIIWDFGRRIIAMRSKCFFSFPPHPKDCITVNETISLIRLFSSWVKWNMHPPRSPRSSHSRSWWSFLKKKRSYLLTHQSAKYQHRHIKDIKVEILRVCVQCYTSYYRWMVCDQESTRLDVCGDKNVIFTDINAEDLRLTGLWRLYVK